VKDDVERKPSRTLNNPLWYRGTLRFLSTAVVGITFLNVDLSHPNHRKQKTEKRSRQRGSTLKINLLFIQYTTPRCLLWSFVALVP